MSSRQPSGSGSGRNSGRDRAPHSSRPRLPIDEKDISDSEAHPRRSRSRSRRSRPTINEDIVSEADTRREGKYHYHDPVSPKNSLTRREHTRAARDSGGRRRETQQSLGESSRSAGSPDPVARPPETEAEKAQKGRSKNAMWQIKDAERALHGRPTTKEIAETAGQRYEENRRNSRLSKPIRPVPDFPDEDLKGTAAYDTRLQDRDDAILAHKKLESSMDHRTVEEYEEKKRRKSAERYNAAYEKHNVRRSS